MQHVAFLIVLSRTENFAPTVRHGDADGRLSSCDVVAVITLLSFIVFVPNERFSSYLNKCGCYFSPKCSKQYTDFWRHQYVADYNVACNGLANWLAERAVFLRHMAVNITIPVFRQEWLCNSAKEDSMFTFRNQ